ncbi:mfs dha1 amino acid exporter [Moniliophthora roreri MCA 2997]|uniref:Mfs dha1 amino acid exporter n=1 Tax=Moniliophthora roreri (strain MCA 2997) TaxID=1381753 RepID=V2Y6L1_MONRO|nr:mfs dha1 amino acid exporter [Moniliophthora roreri MCA 2997]
MAEEPTEQTPLLVEPQRTQGQDPEVVAKPHHAIYDRFTSAQKTQILAQVSYVGLIPLFVAVSFYPTIPEIAKDLDTTAEVVSLAVSISVLSGCIGGLIGASFATFYGRRPTYLLGLPILCIGSIGVAQSNTIPSLMTWRFIQTFGVSSGLSVGAGVIGDIYALEERGMAMGIFFAACLLGQSFGPFVGGFVAYYFDWRIMQLSLGGAGLVGFLWMLLGYPETSLPGSRGIDKQPQNVVFKYLPRFNPFHTLGMLKSPNITAVSLAGMLILFTDYVNLVPLPLTIAPRYGITNKAVLGLLYCPQGVGKFFGAPVAGWLSDRVVRKLLKARGGTWYPEDRLRASLLGGAVLVPLSTLGIGFTTHFISSPKIGLTLDMILLFINGFGIDMVLNPSSTYIVDILQARGAEGIAANYALRAFLTSFAVSAITPMINSIGILGANAVASVSAWTGFGLLVLTIKYGEGMRDWVDVGYVKGDGQGEGAGRG